MIKPGPPVTRPDTRVTRPSPRVTKAGPRVTQTTKAGALPSACSVASISTPGILLDVMLMAKMP